MHGRLKGFRIGAHDLDDIEDPARKPSRYQTIRGNLKEIEVPRFYEGHKAVMVSFGSGTHVVFMVLERLK